MFVFHVCTLKNSSTYSSLTIQLLLLDLTFNENYPNAAFYELELSVFKQYRISTKLYSFYINIILYVYAYILDYVSYENDTYLH